MRPKRKSGKRATDFVFLDANILMYAAGAQHPLREPCRAALQRAVDEDLPLVTDAEVLQEILYRYFLLRKPEIAQAVYRAAVDLCVEVFAVAEPHTARALKLLLGNPDVSPRDAIHAATMQLNGIKRILTSDHHFEGLPQIQRLDPTRFQESRGSEEEHKRKWTR